MDTKDFDGFFFTPGIEDNELKCKFSIICDFLKKDYLLRRVENA